MFEIGNFPYKIVEFTKLSMRQVCNRKKKTILMLTLSKTVKGHSNVKHVANKLWKSRHEWSKLKKMKPIVVSGAFETTV